MAFRLLQAVMVYYNMYIRVYRLIWITFIIIIIIFWPRLLEYFYYFIRYVTVPYNFIVTFCIVLYEYKYIYIPILTS